LPSLRGNFRRINPAKSTIILLEGGNRVLPSFAEPLSRKAVRRLERLGVKVMRSQGLDWYSLCTLTIGDARYRGGTRNELLMDNLAKALIKVWSKLKLPRDVAVRDVGNTEWLGLVRSDVDAVRRAVHTTDQTK
jgi:hypothetical protein